MLVARDCALLAVQGLRLVAPKSLQYALLAQSYRKSVALPSLRLPGMHSLTGVCLFLNLQDRFTSSLHEAVRSIEKIIAASYIWLHVHSGMLKRPGRATIEPDS